MLVLANVQRKDKEVKERYIEPSGGEANITGRADIYGLPSNFTQMIFLTAVSFEQVSWRSFLSVHQLTPIIVRYI